ncbi:MAG TPA: hypothetical protein VFZ52_20515 [Chryseolinea sp.]
MQNITDYLKTPEANLDPREVLQRSPKALLGVTDAAANRLETDLGIKSIFDLASSRIFANAHELLVAGLDPTSTLFQFGTAPADIVNEALVAGIKIDELRFQPINILEGLTATTAASLSTALDVKTVRDLALYPPYLAARAILTSIFFPETLPAYDKDAPADLVPKSGEYPTERVFYKTLVIDELEEDVAQLKKLETAGPVDILPITGADFGFKKPAIGAMLTYSQSWFAQGVALGQLLHSLALAPGESTRMAMIDWSRRSSGKQEEGVSETEALSNTTQHNRALSEVTNAVASEAQSGFSKTQAGSHSVQEGGAAGFSLGPITIGDSSGSASNFTEAMSFSSSSGRRDLSAAMAQNVMDSTQQNANAVRNRRASVVKEVSQEEHEKISTRVVTNYNHMHALSIQYYEVIQIYRVAVQLSEVVKCLFIPMKLINFENPEIVRKFQAALLRAAIDKDAADLLANNFDSVDVKSLATEGFISLKNGGLVPHDIKDAGKVVGLPNETKFTGFYIMPAGVDAGLGVTIFLRDGTQVAGSRQGQNIKFPDTVYIYEIASIGMSNPKPAELPFLAAANFLYKGVPFSFDISIKLAASAASQSILTFTGGGIRAKLTKHLQANRLHYSQAIYKALDPATITLLLSEYAYGNKPLTVQIDPQPVTTAGNYLVFKTHVNPDADGQLEAEREWAEWLAEHGIDFSNVKQDIVPLPSGGVFGEAVLGRYNSAEKLDMTRFWNWQDSPIPLVASDIAPIQAGSRAQEEKLTAGNFSQPLVNIVSPTSLPEPTGMAAALQTIANGNMFRDMSGLASTIGLAQAGLASSGQGAGEAAAQAGSNMATAAKKEVEMFKAALAFAATMFGKGSPDTSPSTISNEGAKVNHGRSMDQRAVTSTGGGSNGVGSMPQGGGSSGGGGGVSPNGTPVVNAGGSHEEAAFNRAVWGTQGQSQGNVAKSLLGFALEAGPAGGGAGPALDAGNFATFVTDNRLDLEIADVLRALDTYPADSWAKQMAAFAHHELSVGNLVAFVKKGNLSKIKAKLGAADHAVVDSDAAVLNGSTNGLTRGTIGGPGAYKGYIMMKDDFVDSRLVPGPGREYLACALVHELTHFRNRDYYNQLDNTPPSTNPALYVDAAKAAAETNTQWGASRLMQEIICDHVAWRVQQDLRLKSAGTPIRTNPDKKGFFKFGLSLESAFNIPGNGYVAHIKALVPSKLNQQIGIWMREAGKKSLFHDDPTKNAAVRQFFEDAYNEVQPQFQTPVVPADGGV